jgi:site-specific DNA recombinase
MGRYGLYLRVSTADQAERYSLPGQRKTLVEYAERAGVEHEVFEDAALSGESLDRPSMQRMMRDVKAKRLTRIVAVDQDRYSRNLADWLTVVDVCRTAGVELATVAKVYNLTDPSDVFMSHVQGATAQYEREQIKIRTMRGKRIAVMGDKNRKIPGRYLTGIATFGYRLRDGALAEVDKEAAAIVRRAFSLALAGESIRGIARTLNMGKSTVSAMLKNEIYTGTAYWNKRRRVSKTKTVFRPRSEWIPVHVPVVIPRSQWERAQKLLKRNAAFAERHQKRFYLLKGVLHCGVCQARMYGQPDHGRRIYECANHITGKCTNKPVRADLIEEAVWSEVLQATQHPEAILELARQEREATFGPSDEALLRLKQINAEIERLPSVRMRILDMHEETIINKAEMKRRITRLDDRQHRLEDELASLNAQMGNTTVDEIEEQMFREVLARAYGTDYALRYRVPSPEELKDPAKQREIVRAVSRATQLETIRATLRKIKVFPNGRLQFEGLIPQMPEKAKIARGAQRKQSKTSSWSARPAQARRCSRDGCPRSSRR